MIGLIQRVSEASVEVEGEVVGQIGRGLLALIGVEKEDSEKDVERLCQRLLGYRVFSDEEGKMSLSLEDIGGEILLVSQFTLAADTQKGARPSFSSAAAPAEGKRLFERLVERVEQQLGRVQTGRFGADMQVKLQNDGPVTFWLQTRAK